MFHLRLIRFVLYITLVQLAVDAATLKKEKGGPKGQKKPAKASGSKAVTDALLSSTTSKAEPSSSSMACSKKRGNDQGDCYYMQSNAPWRVNLFDLSSIILILIRYLQRISQIPWKRIDQFSKEVMAPKFLFQWHTSWGKDVIVYVIDSGVNAVHPGFAKAQVEAGDQVVSLDDVESIPDPKDHGTGMASIIAGQAIGVARQARIYPIKLPIQFTNEEVGEAITIAIRDWKTRYAKNHNLRAVINISLSLNDEIHIEAALEWAISSRMHVIHAATNYGINECYDDNPMGSYRQAKKVGQITVSGVRPVVSAKKDHIADEYEPTFNHGSCVDILAPGAHMLAANGIGYMTSNGTSQATALTSGVVAALLSSKLGYRDLKPEDFREKFLAEFTQKGIVALPPNTKDRMLTMEKLWKA